MTRQRLSWIQMQELWLFQVVLTLKLTNKNSLHTQLSTNLQGLHSLIIKLTQLPLTQIQLSTHQVLSLPTPPTIWNWKPQTQNQSGVQARQLLVVHHRMRALLHIIIKEATWIRKRLCSQMLLKIHLQHLQRRLISKRKNWKISYFKEWIPLRKIVIAIVTKNQRPLCQQNSLRLKWIC